MGDYLFNEKVLIVSNIYFYEAISIM